jgi:hypothetical protein
MDQSVTASTLSNPSSAPTGTTIVPDPKNPGVQGQINAADHEEQTKPADVVDPSVQIHVQQVLEEELHETVAPPVSLHSDIPTPPNAVSGPLKEFGPSVAVPAEIVMPTDVEPDIPQEVKEAGVEASPNTEQPKISQSVQHATGIQPAHDAVPVPITPSDMIKLPMAEADAVQIIKTRSVAEAIRWFATLILRQTKRTQVK